MKSDVSLCAELNGEKIFIFAIEIDDLGSIHLFYIGNDGHIQVYKLNMRDKYFIDWSHKRPMKQRECPVTIKNNSYTNSSGYKKPPKGIEADF